MARKSAASAKDVGVRDSLQLWGKEPSKDGEVSIYDCRADPSTFSPRLAGKKYSRRKSKRRVIFVNGMGGVPRKHRGQACAVSAVAGTPVWGVYNQSRGFVSDLTQCVKDKATSRLGMSATALGSSVKAFVTGADKASLIQSDLMEEFNEKSPPTASVFELLASPTFEDARIVAHSQGNIIVCNALNALAVLKGDAALDRLTVFSFGSPVTFWPKGVDIRKLGFLNDPVSYLSLDTRYTKDGGYGQTTVKVEEGSEVIQRWKDKRFIDHVNPAAQLSHAFYIYVEAYWDYLYEEFSHD